MQEHESNDEDELTATERAWMHFLHAHAPKDSPEPTLRFVRLMIGICERRAKQQ